MIPIFEEGFPKYQNVKNGYMDTLLDVNPPTFERIKKYVDPNPSLLLATGSTRRVDGHAGTESENRTRF